MEMSDHNLDLLLDAWTIAPLDRDLADAIVARASAEDRALDELLARSAKPAQLERDLTGAVLAKARAEDDALDDLLVRGDCVPELPADLAGSVLRTLRRHRLRRRIVALAGAVSAAAAVLVIALTLHWRSGDSLGVRPEVLGQFSTHELKVIRQAGMSQLPKVEDMPVMVHWDTIQAMDQLEPESSAGPADTK